MHRQHPQERDDDQGEEPDGAAPGRHHDRVQLVTGASGQLEVAGQAERGEQPPRHPDRVHPDPAEHVDDEEQAGERQRGAEQRGGRRATPGAPPQEAEQQHGSEVFEQHGDTDGEGLHGVEVGELHSRDREHPEERHRAPAPPGEPEPTPEHEARRDGEDERAAADPQQHHGERTPAGREQ